MPYSHSFKIFITSVRVNHWSVIIEDNKKDSNKMK